MASPRMLLEQRVERLEQALVWRSEVGTIHPESGERARGEQAVLKTFRTLAKVDWVLLPFSFIEYTQVISEPGEYSMKKMEDEAHFLLSVGRQMAVKSPTPPQQRWIDDICRKCHRALGILNAAGAAGAAPTALGR